jgi:hypothetical protein
VNKEPAAEGALSIRHLALGWGALLVFVCLGLLLESLLAFKVGPYVDVDHEARRTMWRLAHAHGTGLALVNVGYGLTVRAVPATADALASGCLVAALLLVPVGFFGGGLDVHGGDPGILVFLVPPGAVALVVGIARVAMATLSSRVKGSC